MPPGVVLLLQVIPLGLGVAIIPTVVAAQLVLLVADSDGYRRGWALAIGRMAGLLLMSVVGLFWLTSLPSFGSGLPTTWEAVIFTAAGVTLLIVAAVEFRRGSRRSSAEAGVGDTEGQPSRMRELMDRSGAWLVFVLSFGWLIFTVQVYALYVPAMHLITNSSAWLAWRVVCFVVLFLLASSTVLVPVLLLAIKGNSVIPLLDRSHAWVSEHSRQITIIVAAVFGAVLLIAGLHEFLQVR